jgi:hypothetical protein
MIRANSFHSPANALGILAIFITADLNHDGNLFPADDQFHSLFAFQFLRGT